MNHPTIGILYRLANGKRIRLKVTVEVKDALELTDRLIQSQKRQERRRHTDYVDGLTDTALLSCDDLADLVHMKDSHQRLHAAIGKLSEAQRRRVLLHYFSGFTHSQIAEFEGVQPMTVTDSIKQARKTLKKLLSQ